MSKIYRNIPVYNSIKPCTHKKIAQQSQTLMNEFDEIILIIS